MINKNRLETNPEMQQESMSPLKKMQASKCPEFQIHTTITQKMDMDLMSIFEYIIYLH